MKPASLQELAQPATSQPNPLAGLTLTIIDNEAKLAWLERYYRGLPAGTLVFFDLETNGLLTPFHLAGSTTRFPVISGLALAADPDRATYLVLDHRNPETSPQFRQLAMAFARWFLGSGLAKGGQNIKFDCLWAWGYFGVKPRHVVVDTLLLSHVLDATRGIHALEKLARQVGLTGYGDELQAWFEANKLDKKEADWTTAPLNLVARKSMADVLACYRFYELKTPLLEARGQEALYYDHVVPSLWAYVTMERHGQLVDEAYLAELEAYLKARQVTSLAKLREVASERFKTPLAADFNFNSGQQLGKLFMQWRIDLLFELSLFQPKYPEHSEFRHDSPLPFLRALKNGNPATDKANLISIVKRSPKQPTDYPKRLQAFQEFAAALLQYKGDEKRLTTYIQGLRRFICPDKRVRSSYLLHGTETSRRSSVDPNRQNDVAEALIRRIYITPPEHVFIINDYSNLEVRIAAALSGDENLIQAFIDGRDIHSFVTSLTYHISYEHIVDVLKRQAENPKEYHVIHQLRDCCKRAIFTILYGGGPNKVALSTGLNFKKACELVDRILGSFPRLDEMFKRLKRYAQRYHRAENDFGRWRPLPGIESPLEHERQEAIRQGLNSPIQGTAADITLLAARRLNKYLEKNIQTAFLAQEVHDSLVVESHLKSLHTAIVASREVMEAITCPSCPDLPLTIDQIVGCYLGSTTKVTPALLAKIEADPEREYAILREQLNHPPAWYDEAT
jgi:DNA polymerase-1